MTKPAAAPDLKPSVKLCHPRERRKGSSTLSSYAFRTVVP